MVGRRSEQGWSTAGAALEGALPVQKGMAEPVAMKKQGMLQMLQERIRQMEGEPFTAKHDDTHTGGELARAAAVYERLARAWLEEAIAAGAEDAGSVELSTLTIDELQQQYPFVSRWPWEPDALKPKGVRRNLERAGALYMAERDRLERVVEAAITRRAELQVRIEACAAALDQVTSSGL